MLSMVDDKLEDLKENLDLEDDDYEQVLKMDKFVDTMRRTGIDVPVDEELEFLEYCALRQSDSLKQVNYEKLCELFEEDYLFGNC